MTTPVPRRGGKIRRMRIRLVCAVIAIVAVPLVAQEAGDAGIVAKIRAEGYERSRVLETFDQLANVIGPRLTNSPAHKRFSVEMLEPRYMPLSGYPRAWSPSTNGVVTAAPVWLPTPSAEALQAKAGHLQGAIVMTSGVQEYFIRADRPPASGDLVTGRPPARPAMNAADLAAALKREGVG